VDVALASGAHASPIGPEYDKLAVDRAIKFPREEISAEDARDAGECLLAGSDVRAARRKETYNEKQREKERERERERERGGWLVDKEAKASGDQ